LEIFDRVVGLDLLKVVHLNDSKGELESRIDRHEHIGLGFIGEEGFKAILRNETIRRLPLILETPIDLRRDDYGNLEKVRELANPS
jgi:deoxyribonuclease-4